MLNIIRVNVKGQGYSLLAYTSPHDYTQLPLGMPSERLPEQFLHLQHIVDGLLDQFPDRPQLAASVSQSDQQPLVIYGYVLKSPDEFGRPGVKFLHATRGDTPTQTRELVFRAIKLLSAPLGHSVAQLVGHVATGQVLVNELMPGITALLAKTADTTWPTTHIAHSSPTLNSIIHDWGGATLAWMAMAEAHSTLTQPWHFHDVILSNGMTATKSSLAEGIEIRLSDYVRLATQEATRSLAASAATQATDPAPSAQADETSDSAPEHAIAAAALKPLLENTEIVNFDALRSNEKALLLHGLSTYKITRKLVAGITITDLAIKLEVRTGHGKDAQLLVLRPTLSSSSDASLIDWLHKNDLLQRVSPAQARQARDDVLALRPALREKPTYLDRLTAPYCPTPFWARMDQLRSLMDWCLHLQTRSHPNAATPTTPDPVPKWQALVRRLGAGFGGARRGFIPPPSQDQAQADQAQGQVRILAGAGGVGKSRLALAMAEGLPKPWVAGWLRPGHDVIARIAACPEPALILVDDADRIAGLAELVEQAAAHQGQIKLLLICRNGQALRSALRQELPEQLRPLLGADPVVLEPVGAGGDRIRWFEQAAQAYARALQLPLPALPALPVGDDRDTMLLLHARALLSVLGGGPALRTLALSDIAEALLTLEQGRWKTNGLASAQALTEVVLALTLLPAATAVETAERLRRLPRYADAPTHLLTDLAEWARAEYPPQPDATLGLRPHLVAEWLLTSRLRQHPELLHNLPADAVQTVFTTLARASHTFPEAAGLLAQAVHGDPTLLAAAVGCADAVGLTPALDQVLADLIDPTNPAQVEVLHTLVITTATARLQARLDQVRVTRLRTLAAHDPDQFRLDLATSLTNLGETLRELGQPQTALPLHRESVQIRRGSTEKSSLRDQRDLARSLTNLGVTLVELGQPQEALPLHRESVQICRGLAGESPQRYRPTLAQSLTNLGATLMDLGQVHDGIIARREAVAILRECATSNPELYGSRYRQADAALRQLFDRLGDHHSAAAPTIDQ